MKFIGNFLTQIKEFNGQTVHLKVIQIDSTNHPLGVLGAMMMGQEQIVRINKAMNTYKSKNSTIEIDADMELVYNSDNEKLIFLNNNFDCNCIEIFRPHIPRHTSGSDMSLWWSYHPLFDNEFNQLTILKNKAIIHKISSEGDGFPIRDIIVNGISHSL